MAKHDFPDSAILRAIAARSNPAPPELSRPKFAVVGGTDTAPAAGQSDDVQPVDPIATTPA
ncbi:hypothetical protein DFR29_102397 [Tahibacter aquaticus]|uniref:Uncharacterized protein n=1 Tax=Tahibacter aquaticus TaxID=520092 RepID=A0A4R6Z7G6_9GAMM|nr:hypothetical protein DFR29_102397 [Tahibacter aquaticus]